jgi:hypothetical protein
MTGSLLSEISCRASDALKTRDLKDSSIPISMLDSISTHQLHEGSIVGCHGILLRHLKGVVKSGGSITSKTS